MKITDFFKLQKKRIGSFLFSYLRQNRDFPLHFQSMGIDVCQKLHEFSSGGKMLRGGLAVLGSMLFSRRPAPEAVKLGAAIELFQSAFLIHDDIMDRDLFRRGEKSLFYQYAEAGKKQGVKDSYHMGESLGICAGDISLFLGFRLLNLLKADPSVRSEITGYCAKELSFVGAAQMIDVYYGSMNTIADEKAILDLYRYKTGRYTFAMPLVTGALLAGCHLSKLNELIEMGENLGIVFQLKDDELGLFGDSERLGKSVGSDIREGKKTLFIYHLWQKAGKVQRKRIKNILGNPKAGKEGIGFIRTLIRELGIDTIIHHRIGDLIAKTEDLFDRIECVNAEARELFLSFIEYNLKRTY